MSPGPSVTGDDDAGSDIATSESTPPYGIWAMSVQYGPVGEPSTPTPALQVELRPDGAAFRWLCVNEPDDGSVTIACPVVARAECLTPMTIGWTGTRWHLDFESGYSGISNQGDITPDGHGNILIDYIYPTYSGGLFRKVADVTSDDPGCTP